MALEVITNERREAERIACSIVAVAFPGGVPCVIVDISPRGARVQCAEDSTIPECCIIVEWQTGRAHDAAVAWHREGEAGLCFLRTCSLEQRVPSGFAEARAAWLAGRDRSNLEILLGAAAN